MLLLKRFFGKGRELPSQNHLRNQPSNMILHYIKEFRSLNQKDQEYLLQKMFTIHSAGITDFNYEEFKDYFLGIQGFSSKALILQERTFGLDVGFAFLTLDRFYYKNNDFSLANEYVTSYQLYGILSNYRGGNLGKELYNISENKIRDEFKDSNRVTFNTTLNSMMYEHRANLTPLVFPGPFELPNDEMEKMIKKMMIKYDVQAISEEKPYVVELSAVINKTNKQKYLKEKDQASKVRQYFLDQTELKENLFLK